MINKRKFFKLFLVLLVVIGIFATILIFQRERKLVKNYKGIFSANYAFNRYKTEDQMQLSFTSVQGFELIRNLFAKLNSCKIDFANASSDYEALIKENYYIYSVNDLKTQLRPIKYASQLTYSNLGYVVENALDFDYKEEINDFIFTGELKNNNSFDGFISRYYYLRFQNTNILNLGGILQGTLEKNGDINDVTFRRNLNASSVEISDQLSVSTISLTEFITLLNSDNDNLRIYKLENIGNLYFVPFNLEEICSSGITIEKLQIEYLYLEEKKVLVPLLRVNGKISVGTEDQKISFWIWFIK